MGRGWLRELGWIVRIRMELFDRMRHEIAPGAVHVPGWLNVDEQRALLAECLRWAEPPGLRAIKVRNGVMSVKTVCLGWHWLPYRYSRFAEDVDGSPVQAMPASTVDLGRRAVVDALGPSSEPFEADAALVNYYDIRARMGMHQDKDERCDAPVVSISLGNSAVFRFGNTTNRNRPYADIELRSGDLFVFGGPSRLAYHGITKTLSNNGDDQIGAGDSRWNITLRRTGLT